MSRAGPLTRSRRRKSRKYQWLQWRETSSAPDSDSGRTSAAHHVGSVRRYPRTEISKFHIARCQFAELKIELTVNERSLVRKFQLSRRVYRYLHIGQSLGDHVRFAFAAYVLMLSSGVRRTVPTVVEVVDVGGSWNDGGGVDVQTSRQDHEQQQRQNERSRRRRRASTTVIHRVSTAGSQTSTKLDPDGFLLQTVRSGFQG